MMGDKNVNVTIPAKIPSNTALIITLYESYQSSFGQQDTATINIVGPGRKNIKIIFIFPRVW